MDLWQIVCASMRSWALALKTRNLHAYARMLSQMPYLELVYFSWSSHFSLVVCLWRHSPKLLIYARVMLTIQKHVWSFSSRIAQSRKQHSYSTLETHFWQREKECVCARALACYRECGVTPELPCVWVVDKVLDIQSVRVRLRELLATKKYRSHKQMCATVASLPLTFTHTTHPCTLTITHSLSHTHTTHSCTLTITHALTLTQYSLLLLTSVAAIQPSHRLQIHIVDAPAFLEVTNLILRHASLFSFPSCYCRKVWRQCGSRNYPARLEDANT